MKRLLSDIAFAWDYRMSLLNANQVPSLRVYMFHSLFENAAERDSGLAFPHEGITLEQFEIFIQQSLEQGCSFILPQSLNQLQTSNDKPSILITFDDGYANNLRVIPILEKYNVPALFCISTRYIAEETAFWWDALWRLTKGDRALLENRKHFSVEENERFLVEKYGRDVLKPTGNTDRPLSITELQQFASHPLVHIANHSHSHPIFTQIKKEKIKSELVTSQSLLTEWTGKAPTLFAYPNGSFDESHREILRSTGFSHAFTTARAFYESDEAPFHVGRVPLYGVRSIQKQLTIHANKHAGWWSRGG